MENSFFVEIKKLKKLYNSSMSNKETFDKIEKCVESLAALINLGKLKLEYLGEDVIIYDNNSSSKFYQIESSKFVMQYCPIEGHDFDELEIEKIEILNEIISNLLNKNINRYNDYEDIEKTFNLLKKDEKLDEYAFWCLNLNNYNYLKDYLGSYVDELLDMYYSELSGLIDLEEHIFRTDKRDFVAFIKKENLTQFIEFKKLIEKNFGSYKLDVRAGIYNIDRNSKYPLVCENASIALYMAEHVYKTRELVFEEDMKRELIKEQKIISLFPQALKDGEFCVYYQPKVDLTTSSMYGSEALVRWNKDGEVISPGYFIPVLEQENILYKLDFYVLEQVCKDMRRWLDMGLKPVKTSINFSKKNVRRPDFIIDLMNILSRYQIESKYIEIELTETAEMFDDHNLVSFVDVMHENDINVSIDDFGTGYSSLSLIKHLAANSIKIDKCFIDSIGEKKSSIVVKNIINIANELGIEVIAEGIETEEQIAILKELGCEKIQGYFFDRPLPRESFEKRMLDSQFYIKQTQKTLNPPV